MDLGAVAAGDTKKARVIPLGLCDSELPISAHTDRGALNRELFRHEVRHQFIRKFYSLLPDLLSSYSPEIGQLRESVIAIQTQQSKQDINKETGPVDACRAMEINAGLLLVPDLLRKGPNVFGHIRLAKDV